MATIKKRLNITLSKEAEKALDKVAERDKTPKATKAAQLLEIALEIEEDRIWEMVANRRDTKHSKFVSHAKAWK